MGLDPLTTAVKVVVVFALLWFTLRLVIRLQGGGRPRRRPSRVSGGIEVLDRCWLARDVSVQLTRVGDRVLLLGVTGHHVSLLGELDLPAGEETGPEPPLTARTPVGPTVSPWKAVLEGLRERTVRR